MELLTRIDIAPFAQKIDLNSSIMLLGSCFTTSIGTMLQSYGFNAYVNPFGVLFNPASIANACERLANPHPFEATEVIDISQNRTTDSASNSQPSRFCSFSHHSSFAKGTAQEFLDNANNSLAQASDFFRKADTLIITLGTAYVFHHIQRNIIVSNCHKIVPQEFSRELLTIGQSTGCLERIAKAAQGKRIIFTVSPVRHLADGAHSNQLSKSTLLHAINELTSQTAQTRADQATDVSMAQEGKTTERKINELSPVENKMDYFPAYEIMMDELRDYRFYAEDMVHPSEVAVKHIFERFTQAAIADGCKNRMLMNHKDWLFTKHRNN